MTDSEKALTYDEAKQLCHMAFDAGSDYGRTCMQYNCNALAYDWEHWLAKNARLFKPTPTVEDVLDKFANAVLGCDNTEESVQRVIAEYAAKLRLAERVEQ